MFYSHFKIDDSLFLKKGNDKDRILRQAVGNFDFLDTDYLFQLEENLILRLG